eukprot:Ihof_evm3s16 gene=Ihof_evmTU3s16
MSVESAPAKASLFVPEKRNRNEGHTQCEQKRPRVSLKLKGTNKVTPLPRPAHVFFQSPGPIKDENKRSLGLAGVSKEEISPHEGLSNLGNTCYANAVLQVLSHCPLFRRALASLCASLPSKPVEAGQGVAIALRDLFSAMDQSPLQGPDERRVGVDATACLSAIRNKSGMRMFEPGIQHDAQEFLMMLLGVLGDLPDGKQVVQVFQGAMQIETVCLECEKQQGHNEAFLDISLPVKANGMGSLSWAIATHVASEKLEGSNRYHCDNCRSLQEAERRMHFQVLPPVLALHLKRFSFGPGGSGVVSSKVCSSLPVPTTLCLWHWCSAECKEKATIYELQAFVVHQGTAIYSGHYVAFTQVTSPDG